MRELGIIRILLAAMPNLAGCESSWSKDPQFQKQLKRAQECRQLQDKLAQASEADRGRDYPATADLPALVSPASETEGPHSLNCSDSQLGSAWPQAGHK